MEMATKRNRHHHDYRVAWVRALPLEMAAAKAMLDEIYPGLPTSSSDQNTYELGRIHAHNVVIACLPAGVYGTTPAATVATQMLSTFTSIRFGLMVGLGGWAPSKKDDSVILWSASQQETVEVWCNMIWAKQ
jgi:nucleoside phosphorylase